MRILSDEDALALGPAEAVAAMREALIAPRGASTSPRRASTTIGDTRLLFGAGGSAAHGVGLRISGPATAPLEHLTVTWRPDGEIDAIILGNEIGARRTGGSIGGAGDLLAEAGPLRVGIVGSGRNGWAQVWALTGVREVAELAIFSPTEAHRERFAARACDELGLAARAVEQPRDAVEAMDLVILCTTSREPVIDATWVRDGAHVTSIGAKSTAAHELPEELLGRVERAVSDAPDELSAPVSDLAGLPMLSLGSLLIDGAPTRRDGAVSLFFYSGLGGSDAAYGQALAARAALAD